MMYMAVMQVNWSIPVIPHCNKYMLFSPISRIVQYIYIYIYHHICMHILSDSSRLCVRRFGCGRGRGRLSEQVCRNTWWRNQMEPFSALLALGAGNPPVTGESPAQRPVTRRFDVFFDLYLNKRLSKQSRDWWFETPLRSLWRHCNDLSSRVCFMQNNWNSITTCECGNSMFISTKMKRCDWRESNSTFTQKNSKYSTHHSAPS